MLVVLDLTPKPDWIRNIRDSMWADHIPAPAPDQRGRWAVVVLAIMKPLTEQEIRAAFVNCTKGEAKRLSVPRDLADRPWDDLDYLGWRDPQAPDRAYLVTELDGRPRALAARCLSPVSWQMRRSMCLVCVCSLYVRGKKDAGVGARLHETITLEEKIQRTVTNISAFVAKVTA